jgi:uncharacterized protein
MSRVIRIEGDSCSADALRDSLRGILEDTILFTLATLERDKDGTVNPWTNTAYFAWTEDFRLHFLSPPSSRHCRNIADNPSIALTVFDTRQSGEGGKVGLQAAGRCARSTGSQLEKALRSYQARFDGFDKVIAEPADFDKTAMESRLYTVTLTSVKVFDEPAFGEEHWIEATIED